MSYTLYRMMTLPSNKQMKREGYTHEEIRERDFRDGNVPLWHWRSCINAVLKTYNRTRNGSSVCQVLLEHWWHETGRHTIFVPDMRLIGMVMEAKFSLDFENIHFPFNAPVSFAFPKGATYDGLPLCPMVIGKTPLPKLYEEIMGHPAGPWYTDYEEEHGDHWIVNLRNDGFETAILTASRATDITEYMDHRRPLEGQECGLPQFEEKALRMQSKMGLAFVTYLQAFPELLRAGFPKEIPAREQRTVAMKPHMLDLPPKFRDTPEMHWRSGHFRHLRNDRFKRNPDGTVKVVYINPMVVAGRVDPHTVEESQ